MMQADKATAPGRAVSIGFAGRPSPWLKASRLYSGPLFETDAMADKYDTLRCLRLRHAPIKRLYLAPPKHGVKWHSNYIRSTTEFS